MPRSQQSHKVTVDILDGLALVPVASADTVDGTQHKRLLAAVGKVQFIVRRWYPGDSPRPRTDTDIYDGPDLAEAVRIYNGLG